MSFVPPDPNVFYPIPPGQLPPGFIPPPPGTAVRGIPIVVPFGLEMLISPEGFPVFVPVRAPVATSPAHPSPGTPNSHVSPGSMTQPTPPQRHNTVRMSVQHPGMPLPQQQPPPLPQPTAAPAPPPPGLTFASIISSFRTSSESVSAWTFYSMGLAHNPGQKEIVITLRQRPGSYTLESIQPCMYELYHQMNRHIQSKGGKTLTAGDVFTCRLQTPDMGMKDISVLLVHSPQECKGTIENKDVLYGLIATTDEVAVFSKYGAARCLTNMGSELETWPIPLWSDWSRPSLLTLNDFRGSLTELVSVLPTKNVVATFDTIARRLTLVISQTALEMIQADLKRFPPAVPGLISDMARVTFLLDLDAGSQAYLTWRTGQEGQAIFNARPNPTGYHACWITLSGIGAHQVHLREGISSREDGMELRMLGATWERLYQALCSRTPAVVPVGGETIQLSYA